ncbi:hypothetical protein [Bradyrhizobium liaoningense]|nr:hypothetical protein [Bradyrhizobium liaoningense]
MNDTKKSLKITKADELTKEKIAEINKILADIEAGKIKPSLFSLHLKI